MFTYTERTGILKQLKDQAEEVAVRREVGKNA